MVVPNLACRFTLKAGFREAGGHIGMHPYTHVSCHNFGYNVAKTCVLWMFTLEATPCEAGRAAI